MEDQDKRTEEQEDVEAHRRKSIMANEEAEREDADVEAHGKNKPKIMANEEPEAEGEDEDFELHRKSPRAL
ncbi:MAG: hypothetical protein ICV67_06655 [Thermoleophilia bacterium]|nr:hypothetical protein [Thermoleophilia bacterium]